MEADVIFCFCYKFYGLMPGNQYTSSVSKIISRLLPKHRNHLQDNVNRPSYNGNRTVKFFKTEKGLRTEDNYGQGMMDGLALLYIKKGASNIDYSNLIPVCCKEIKEAGFCAGGTTVKLSHTYKYI